MKNNIDSKNNNMENVKKNPSVLKDIIDSITSEKMLEAVVLAEIINKPAWRKKARRR